MDNLSGCIFSFSSATLGIKTTKYSRRPETSLFHQGQILAPGVSTHVFVALFLRVQFSQIKFLFPIKKLRHSDEERHLCLFPTARSTCFPTQNKCARVTYLGSAEWENSSSVDSLIYFYFLLPLLLFKRKGKFFSLRLRR